VVPTALLEAHRVLAIAAKPEKPNSNQTKPSSKIAATGVASTHLIVWYPCLRLMHRRLWRALTGSRDPIACHLVAPPGRDIAMASSSCRGPNWGGLAGNLTVNHC
jgi:hypothetical protein